MNATIYIKKKKKNVQHSLAYQRPWDDENLVTCDQK